MYQVKPHPSAQEAVAALPDVALAGYAEALGLMRVFPWRGEPFKASNPGGNIRTLPFGAAGLVTYMILEREQEVHVLEVQWVG